MSTSGSATLSGDAATAAAGVDLKFVMDAYKNANGSDAFLTINLTHGTTDKAEIANDGSALTLTLDSNKDYSAEDITELLKGATIATGGTLSDDVKASILEAVHGAIVSGTGTTAATGTGNSFAAATGNITKSNANGKELVLQIGDTSDDFNQLSVGIKSCKASAIGVGSLSIANQTDAAAALDIIKGAINYVSDVRGTLGATQNRLDHTINNLSVMQENIQDAESTIRDTDIADEMMAYTKNNILIQSAQAMLAQANTVPQGVLQLLQ